MVVELRLCLFNCIQYVVIFVVSRGRNTVDAYFNARSFELADVDCKNRGAAKER